MDNATVRREIVDTHRRPWGQKMLSEIEERGLLDLKQGFPQTNALDLMAYREVCDLDYAMPLQRRGGITLSLMTNSGEMEWLGRSLLHASTAGGGGIGCGARRRGRSSTSTDNSGCFPKDNLRRKTRSTGEFRPVPIIAAVAWRPPDHFVLRSKDSACICGGVHTRSGMIYRHLCFRLPLISGSG